MHGSDETGGGEGLEYSFSSSSTVSTFLLGGREGDSSTSLGVCTRYVEERKEKRKQCILLMSLYNVCTRTCMPIYHAWLTKNKIRDQSIPYIPLTTSKESK